MADAIEGHVDKGKKGDRSGLLWGGSDSLRWIESPSDLPVTVAVPLESVLEKLQLIIKTFVITQVSGPMYQRGKHSLFVGRVVVSVGMEIEVGVWVYGRLYGPMSHQVYGIYQCLGRVGGHLFPSP
jgi:hypothetical protein